jgi:hypothetical protein
MGYIYSMKLRNSLRRLTRPDVLMLVTTTSFIILCSLLPFSRDYGEGWDKGWVKGLWFINLTVEALAVGSYVPYALDRRRQRLRARFALLKDDPAALEDAERRSDIRRRIHRRLVRRALATAPTALLVALGGLLGSFMALDDLKAVPVLAGLSAYGLAIGTVLLLGWLAWRRIGDMFGAPLILLGHVVPPTGSTEVELEEGGDPEMLGADSVGEMSSPQLPVDVTAAWRLAPDGTLTSADQPLGERSVELVSGAVLAVPRTGPVALVCSARGRCIGRLGQFDLSGQHPESH